MDERTYSSSEVSTLTGATLRQLQWWDERKLVTVRHEGHRRFYTETDRTAVHLIVRLRAKQISIQAIRKVLRPAMLRLDQIIGSDSFLVTDGRQAKVVDAVMLPEVCDRFSSKVAVIAVQGTSNGHGRSQKVPAGSKAKSRKI